MIKNTDFKSSKTYHDNINKKADAELLKQSKIAAAS